MENSTHTFINLVLYLIKESKIKKNRYELEFEKDKRVHFLKHVSFPKEIFLTFMFYLNV